MWFTSSWKCPFFASNREAVGVWSMWYFLRVFWTREGINIKTHWIDSLIRWRCWWLCSCVKRPDRRCAACWPPRLRTATGSRSRRRCWPVCPGRVATPDSTRPAAAPSSTAAHRARSCHLCPLSQGVRVLSNYELMNLINPPWLHILSVCSALQHRPASCFQDTWEPSGSSASPTVASPTALPLSCSSSAQCTLFGRAGALHCTPADEAGLPLHQKGSLSGFLPPSTTSCAFISLQLEVAAENYQ